MSFPIPYYAKDGRDRADKMELKMLVKAVEKTEFWIFLTMQFITPLVNVLSVSQQI